MAEKLNLDTLVAGTVHSHYYKKVDGSEAGNSKYVSNVERSKDIYSSPRNIRKLFIKCNGIDIVYYRPLVGRTELSETIKYKDVDTKLIIRALKEYLAEMSGRLPSNVDRVNVSGTGFDSFLKDLSISNLEELYFDWSLLLGNKELFGNMIRFTGAGILGVKVFKEEMYMEPNSVRKGTIVYVKAETLEGESWGNVSGGRELAAQLVNYVTTCMCGSKKGGLATNYPRLKYIGFIGNSGVILKSDGGITKESLKKYDRQAIYNFYDPKKLNEIFGSGTNGLFKFSMFVDTGVDLFDTAFRVDTKLYQFDSDKLEDYFKGSLVKEMSKEFELTKWFTESIDTSLGIESKLWWVKQFRSGNLVAQKSAAKSLEGVKAGLDKEAAKKAKQQDEAVEKVTDELEMLWNGLYRRQGMQELKKILTGLMYESGTKQVLYDAVATFTKQGQEFYNKVLDEIEFL